MRILLLSAMLTLAGIAFVGIGMFRYTPHPICTMCSPAVCPV